MNRGHRAGMRFVFLCCAGTVLSACSGTMIAPYHAQPNDYRYPHADQRELGTLHFGGTPEVPQEQIHLYKIHKGYALRGHLDESPSKATALRLSRDKDYKWFGGLEWRWNF